MEGQESKGGDQVRLESMARFDESIPEALPVGACEGCNEVILSGEEHFNYDGELIHDDGCCLSDYFKKIAEYKA
jgi:hypothetical protein